MSEKFIMSDISSCARCQGDHLCLVFTRLTHPAGPNDEWTYWAPCPKNNEPILLGAQGSLEECGNDARSSIEECGSIADLKRRQRVILDSIHDAMMHDPEAM